MPPQYLLMLSLLVRMTLNRVLWYRVAVIVTACQQGNNKLRIWEEIIEDIWVNLGKIEEIWEEIIQNEVSLEGSPTIKVTLYVICWQQLTVCNVRQQLDKSFSTFTYFSQCSLNDILVSKSVSKPKMSHSWLWHFGFETKNVTLCQCCLSNLELACCSMFVSLLGGYFAKNMEPSGPLCFRQCLILCTIAPSMDPYTPSQSLLIRQLFNTTAPSFRNLFRNQKCHTLPMLFVKLRISLL